MANSHNALIMSRRSDSLFLTNVTDQAMSKMDTGGEIISSFARTVIVFVNHVIFDMCICVCGIAGHKDKARTALNFDPELNKSRLGRAVKENETVIVFLINISHVHLSIIAFVVVIVNTAILVVSLKRKSEWRKNATRSQNETLSNREKKAVMLVISVATVLIVCYAPGVTCAFIELLVPDFTFMGNKKMCTT
ncbi:thyrotropin-releasing hormone receptor [Biomphalaria pfeifferi]|uniref:Thyrotropin-releasing hormone receptor n=1 Tax=Biomphalaria pfeifferi TaxID=112525 RepID=A0AAD8F483_BIOPF|nr:thyrotropin-releasing hormone receptor [Biomphalaria pfeifferi]